MTIYEWRSHKLNEGIDEKASAEIGFPLRKQENRFRCYSDFHSENNYNLLIYRVSQLLPAPLEIVTVQ